MTGNTCQVSSYCGWGKDTTSILIMISFIKPPLRPYQMGSLSQSDYVMYKFHKHGSTMSVWIIVTPLWQGCVMLLFMREKQVWVDNRLVCVSNGEGLCYTWYHYQPIKGPSPSEQTCRRWAHNWNIALLSSSAPFVGLIHKAQNTQRPYPHHSLISLQRLCW